MPRLPKPSTGVHSSTGRKNPVPLGRPASQGKAFQLDRDEFYLRSLRHTDASPEFAGWMNDPEVVSGINIPELNMSVERLARYITTFDNLRKYLIGIFVKPDMKLIGFYQIDVDVRHRRGTITAVIGNRDWWGEGVFKRTSPGLVDAFFEHRNIDKMSVRITSRNKKILYSLMGTRFKHEGCLKGEVLAPDGQRLDIHIFGRLKSSDQ